LKKNQKINPEKQSKASLQKSLRILLLDDDPSMSTLLKTLLTLEGFQVESFDGMDKDVIEFIRSDKPDVLIMDIHLRTHNGIDITRSLRMYPDLSYLKIIITSGMDQSYKSLTAGANFFLLKPYMPDELIKILREK
jgi:DNA-binding response OmpR family regulator